MFDLSKTVNRKFVDSVELSDWEIETDSGWQPTTHIHKTDLIVTGKQIGRAHV